MPADLLRGGRSMACCWMNGVMAIRCRLIGTFLSGFRGKLGNSLRALTNSARTVNQVDHQSGSRKRAAISSTDMRVVSRVGMW